MPINLRVLRLDQDLPLPAYAKPGDAGLDLLARYTLTLDPGETAIVPTGIAVALPDGYAGFVQSRSGLAAKHSVFVLNSPGLIDSGFRGEIGVILHNANRDEGFGIVRGDRIAQLVIQRVEQVEILTVGALEPSVRGEGGFGHTGV